MIAVEAPPLVHVQRITSHSKLSEIVKVFSEAPPVKETKMKPISVFEKRARTNYNISRMKTFAKSAQSPDMNMTLNEIRTGVKMTDKIALSLFVYTVCVFIMFFSMFK
jgi:hypothetical protein